MSDIALFSLAAGHAFAAQVANHLDIDLAPHEERHFEDGEHKICPLHNVRGRGSGGNPGCA